HVSQTNARPPSSRPGSRAKSNSTSRAGDRSHSKAEARAREKKNVAARREELLVGLCGEDKREMKSFMGSVDSQARDTLESVVRMISASGQDPRLLMKKVLVHALARLDIDKCVSFLETMRSLGQDAMLQLLWLYERYNVPNAGGGMTKCTTDHFGRDMGIDKVEEIFGMTEGDKKDFLLQLADWDPVRKLKVMKAWEATDPAMAAGFLLELVREEKARGEGPGNLWQCSLCPIRRDVDIQARMKRGEHRRKDRTVDAGGLYDYSAKGRGGRPDTYASPHDSLFELTPQTQQQQQQQQQEENLCKRDTQQQLQLKVTYAGKDFDTRRMCGVCTEELRGAIVSSGHDVELWHTVDHERRALVTAQRQNDVFKARWAERERKDRQVSELLRFICEANLDAFSRHSLEDRAKAIHDTQASRLRLLDLKLSDATAVKAGARKDEELKLLNEREATARAAKLRLKASLDMDRHYASLEPGGLPASTRRRQPTSTKPSDFLDDGTPATPQGAAQTFGCAGPPEGDESGDIRRWKGGAKRVEEILDLRRGVRDWQSSFGRQARFSYLCERWVGAASDIEEKQRMKRMIEAAEHVKRIKESQEAKALRKLQLAELRATARSRATGEERRKGERDKEAEGRIRREREELERMSAEEAAQLAGGDRYWGLVREMQRLRIIEEERRFAWEARIRATREKMVAIRCISELSDFTHSIPPRDQELQQKIDRLMAI
ncbi:unnamed protein product, partial [Pylaiella littoralis]